MSVDRLVHEVFPPWASARRGLVHVVCAEWALVVFALLGAFESEGRIATIPLALAALVWRAYGYVLWRGAPLERGGIAARVAHTAAFTTVVAIGLGVLLAFGAFFSGVRIAQVTVVLAELTLDVAYFVSLYAAATHYEDATGRTFAVVGLATLGLVIGVAVAMVLARTELLALGMTLGGAQLVMLTAASLRMRDTLQRREAEALATWD